MDLCLLFLNYKDLLVLRSVSMDMMLLVEANENNNNLWSCEIVLRDYTLMTNYLFIKLVEKWYQFILFTYLNQNFFTLSLPTNCPDCYLMNFDNIMIRHFYFDIKGEKICNHEHSIINKNVYSLHNDLLVMTVVAPCGQVLYTASHIKNINKLLKTKLYIL